jgi:hypothetical protein
MADSILFAVTVAGVAIWWIVTTLLLFRLVSKHSGEYQNLGRPHGFTWSRPSSNFRFLVFIVARRHRELGDKRLSLLSDVALAAFGITIGALLTLMVVTVHR